jgi:preprotein translocase subunit SecB
MFHPNIASLAMLMIDSYILFFVRCLKLRRTDMSEQDAVFTLERIYLKDFSFESPNPPQSFKTTESPVVDVGVRTMSAFAEGMENAMEVVVTVAVRAEVSGRSYFAVEIQQAGLFVMKNIPEDRLPFLLQVHCPNILYPYARATVADLVIRGGFQPLHLRPANFRNLATGQGNAR